MIVGPIAGPIVIPTMNSLSIHTAFVGPNDRTNRLAQQSKCVDLILTVGPTVGPVTVIEIERVQF
jgi:hypothetical protein